MPIPIYVSLLRFIIPLFIFKWPLWGTIASALMDTTDWSLISFHSPADYIFYQNWDKTMDIYYLSIAVITIRKWKDKLARRLAVGLFFYRLLGIFIFWITQNRMFLFVFPNFFENFFIFYLLFVFIFKRVHLISSKRILVILTLILAIPKLINEYFLHVIEKQIWQVYNFGQILGFSGYLEASVNFFAQGLLLFIIPFIVGLVLIQRDQKSH